MLVNSRLPGANQARNREEAVPDRIQGCACAETMANAVERPATPRLARALWRLGLVAAFIGNVTALYGVLYWQWDTFQLLMLYWMETVILAFWTLMRLSMLSRGKAHGSRRGRARVSVRRQRGCISDQRRGTPAAAHG